MMKACSMKSQLSQSLPTQTTITPKLSYSRSNTCACAHNNAPNKLPMKPYGSTNLQLKYKMLKSHSHPPHEQTTSLHESTPHQEPKGDYDSLWRCLAIGGAASMLVLLMMDTGRAWALGPEGPLVEEFWENVRRYALYALTVSTGVIYTVVQPIVELLKNPISAVLVLIIIGGTFFIVSQILSAMVGVSDFSYDYAY